MKRHGPLLLLSLLAAAPLPAASPVGMLPEEKQAITLSDAERNPFGKPGPKTPLKPEEDTESEEARIRGIFGGLSTVGVGERDGEYSALVGSLVVKAGSELPPILPNQKERLRVLRVRKDTIEIGFVEKDETAETRTITLIVAMKPEVRYDLGIRTAKPESAESSGTLGGVIKSNETSQK